MNGELTPIPEATPIPEPAQPKMIDQDVWAELSPEDQAEIAKRTRVIAIAQTLDEAKRNGTFGFVQAELAEMGYRIELRSPKPKTLSLDLRRSRGKASAKGHDKRQRERAEKRAVA